LFSVKISEESCWSPGINFNYNIKNLKIKK
jgi:hypothetical protein